MYDFYSRGNNIFIHKYIYILCYSLSKNIYFIFFKFFTCSGQPILSKTEARDFWLRWSPDELSIGRGLRVDSQLIESEVHPAPVELNLNLKVYTLGFNNDVEVTIHYSKEHTNTYQPYMLELHFYANTDQNDT